VVAGISQRPAHGQENPGGVAPRVAWIAGIARVLRWSGFFAGNAVIPHFKRIRLAIVARRAPLCQSAVNLVENENFEQGP
jgi:hypothetical protein